MPYRAWFFSLSSLKAERSSFQPLMFFSVPLIMAPMLGRGMLQPLARSTLPSNRAVVGVVAMVAAQTGR